MGSEEWGVGSEERGRHAFAALMRPIVEVYADGAAKAWHPS